MEFFGLYYLFIFLGLSLFLFFLSLSLSLSFFNRCLPLAFVVRVCVMFSLFYGLAVLSHNIVSHALLMRLFSFSSRPHHLAVVSGGGGGGCLVLFPADSILIACVRFVMLLLLSCSCLFLKRAFFSLPIFSPHILRVYCHIFLPWQLFSHGRWNFLRTLYK